MATKATAKWIKGDYDSIEYCDYLQAELAIASKQAEDNLQVIKVFWEIMGRPRALGAPRATPCVAGITQLLLNQQAALTAVMTREERECRRYVLEELRHNMCRNDHYTPNGD